MGEKHNITFEGSPVRTIQILGPARLDDYKLIDFEISGIKHASPFFLRLQRLASSCLIRSHHTVQRDSKRSYLKSERRPSEFPIYHTRQKRHLVPMQMV